MDSFETQKEEKLDATSADFYCNSNSQQNADTKDVLFLFSQDESKNLRIDGKKQLPHSCDEKKLKPKTNSIQMCECGVSVLSGIQPYTIAERRGEVRVWDVCSSLYCCCVKPKYSMTVVVIYKLGCTHVFLS